MTTQERVLSIERVAQNTRQENLIKAMKEQKEISQLIEKIEEKSKEVFPRIFAIAETLVRNGYYIGEKRAWDKSPTFCTDGICHRMGFYLESGNPFLSAKGSMPVAFGCKGGGWNGTDFKINKEGKVVSYDYSHCWCRDRMQDYCKDIDVFEERFNAWVDELLNK